MNKDEILKKAQEEKQDEMEKQVDLQASKTALGVGAIVIMILYTVKRSVDVSADDVYGIWFIMLGTTCLYSGIKTKQKTSIVTGALALVLGLASVTHYILELIG